MMWFSTIYCTRQEKVLSLTFERGERKPKNPVPLNIVRVQKCHMCRWHWHINDFSFK